MSSRGVSGWGGGGSAMGMLRATKAESREFEVTTGSEGGLGSRGMGKGIEGRWEEVQRGKGLVEASGMLIGVTKGFIAEEEASTSETKRVRKIMNKNSKRKSIFMKVNI